MSIKEIIENNLVLVIISFTITGFIAGIGVYKGILGIANQETVTKGSYKLNEFVNSNYVEKNEYDSLKNKYDEIIKANGNIIKQSGSRIEKYQSNIRFDKLSKNQKDLANEFLQQKDVIESALDEVSDPHNSMLGNLSPNEIKIYNKLAKQFNIEYKKNLFLFPEDTTPNMVTHPKASEVYGQVILAIKYFESI